MGVPYKTHGEEKKLVLACILVGCEGGKFRAVADAVKKLKGVKVAFPVVGRWDVVAQVEVADREALSKIVLKINGLRGVKYTETLVQVMM